MDQWSLFSIFKDEWIHSNFNVIEKKTHSVLNIIEGLFGEGHAGRKKACADPEKFLLHTD